MMRRTVYNKWNIFHHGRSQRGLSSAACFRGNRLIQVTGTLYTNKSKLNGCFATKRWCSNESGDMKEPEMNGKTETTSASTSGKVLGKLPPFWGLPEDPSEQGTLLGLKLPKEPVNIPHEMFFWPNEEEFLRRAARAFENTSKALFAPSSELRAVTMSSEMENKMTEPTDVLEDILHYWLLSRAQAFRKSGAHTAVDISVEKAQLLQIDYFFVMANQQERSDEALPIHYDGVSQSYTSLDQVVSLMEALKLIILQMKRPTIAELAKEMYIRARVRFDCQERHGVYEVPPPDEHVERSNEGPDIRYTTDYEKTTHVVTFEIGFEKASEDIEFSEKGVEESNHLGISSLINVAESLMKRKEREPVTGEVVYIRSPSTSYEAEETHEGDDNGPEQDATHSSASSLEQPSDGGSKQNTSEREPGSDVDASEDSTKTAKASEEKEINDDQQDSKSERAKESSTKRPYLFTSSGALAFDVHGVKWTMDEGWRMVDIDGNQPQATSFFPFVRRALEAVDGDNLVVVRSSPDEEDGDNDDSDSDKDTDKNQQQQKK